MNVKESINAWTGLGCDMCGFGTVENVNEFDPTKPCPECGTVTIPQMTRGEFIAQIFNRLIEVGIDEGAHHWAFPNMTCDDFKSLTSHVSDALIYFEPLLEERLKQIVDAMSFEKPQDQNK